MRVGRFRGRKALREVLVRGIRFERHGVSIRCRKGELLHHRVAVVCPRGVTRKAVERNRIRRVFFEALRLLLKEYERPVDCAVIIRKKFDARQIKRSDVDAIVAGIRPLIQRL